MTQAGPHRPPRWLLITALVALAGVGLATWLVVRADPYVAPPPPPDTAPRVDASGAVRALEALERAVVSRDASATGLAGDLVANAEALQVEDFTLRYVDATSAVEASGSWSAAVDVTWRFAGFDRTPARDEVLVGFDSEGGEVSITGFGGGDRRSPLWLGGPLQVRRTAGVLVLSAGSPAETELVAGRAAAAVPVVRRVLPRWPGRLVVEVPDSEEGLDRLLAAEPGTYANIAAVSASVDGTLTPDSPVHILVNPALYHRLEPTGAQVVMSHEATHVATGAPVSSGVPLWLLEGFADYVALRDVELPVATTAAQIIKQVRGQGLPDHLPGVTEFDETATHLGAAYESAWIACVVLSERGGEQALVRLYEQVRRGQSLTDSLRGVFDLTEPALTALWRDRLRDLAAGPAPA